MAGEKVSLIEIDLIDMIKGLGKGRKRRGMICFLMVSFQVHRDSECRERERGKERNENKKDIEVKELDGNSIKNLKCKKQI